jgi:hypothetical protein
MPATLQTNCEDDDDEHQRERDLRDVALPLVRHGLVQLVRPDEVHRRLEGPHNGHAFSFRLPHKKHKNNQGKLCGRKHETMFGNSNWFEIVSSFHSF